VNETSVNNVNLVYGYAHISKNNTEVGFQLGLFKNYNKRHVFSEIRNENWSNSRMWYHLSLFAGKRYFYNRLLFTSIIGIPIEVVNNNKKHMDLEQYNTNGSLFSSSIYLVNYAPTISTGVFFNQGIYYNLFKKIYIGFDLRIGINYELKKGIYYEKQEVYYYDGSPTQSVENKAKHSYGEITLPLLSNIGLKYRF